MSREKLVLPRPPASRAMPQPLTPPPMIARSKIRSKGRFPGVRQFILAISLSVWSKAQPNVKATEKGKWGLYRSGRPKRRFPRTESSSLAVIARSAATKQSILSVCCSHGLLPCARNDAYTSAQPRDGRRKLHNRLVNIARSLRHRLDHLDASAVADVCQSRRQRGVGD